MPSAPHYSLTWLQRGAVLGAIGIAVLAIIGAAFDLPLLARGRPDLPPLTPSGAVAIIASAVATLTGPRIRRLIGMALLLSSTTIVSWLGAASLNWLTFNPFAPLPIILILVDLMLGGVMLLGSSSPHPRMILIGQLAALVIILNAARTLVGVFQTNNQIDLLISLNTGRALTSTSATLLIGVAALCVNPRQGLMELVTSRRVAGQLLRILLLAGTMLPISLTVLSELAWRAGIFGSTVGLLLMLFANLIVFYRVAVAYDRADSARRSAEQALAASHAELDQRVAERTAALADREAQLRALSNNLPGAMIFQITRDAYDQPHFLYVSAGAKDVTGLAPEQILANPQLLYAQIEPTERAAFLTQELASRRAKEIFDIEVRKRTPMGLRWTRIRSRPRPTTDGRRIWDGIEVDITAQKEAQVALERDRRVQAALFTCSRVLLRPATSPTERKAALNLVLDQLLAGTASDRAALLRIVPSNTHDPQTMVQVERCAPGVEASLTVMQREQLTFVELPAPLLEQLLQGESLLGVTPAGLAAYPEFASFLTGLGVRSLVVIPIHDGQAVTTCLGFHACASNRVWGDQERLLLQTAADLIAAALQRWADEDELRRREALLSALFEMLPVGVMISHRDGSLARANQTLQTMMGMTMADFAVNRQRELTYTLPDGRPLTREYWPITRALKGEIVRDYELSIIRLDGTQRWVSVSAAPLTEADMGAAMVATDITERRLAEQERLQIERQLQEARRIESLDVMAAGVAHDFNNILTAMLGHAELIRFDAPAGSELAASLDAIILGARRAAALTAQMLAYAGKSYLAVEPVALNDVARELMELLRASLPAGVTMRCTLDPNDPQLMADATQVRQILLNFLTNAIEAVVNVGGGSIVVRTGMAILDQTMLCQAAFSVAHPGAFGFLEVQDSGEGIAPERLDRIFEPFYSTRFTGRGLGLAAVQGIVRAHAGALFVRSSPDQGATFSAYLPGSSHPDSPVG
ncbi:MAG: ATP-binding protein [Oscillochloridaceae bacterium umkhey_bin13]